jgi:plastocyanin
MPRRPTVGPSARLLRQFASLAHIRNVGKPVSRRKGVFLTATLVLFGLLPATTAPVAAQTTVVVKLRADTETREYTIEPSVIRVHARDVVVFRVVSGAPHSITFDSAGLSPQAHTAINAALTRRSADLSSPLLVADGTEYRFVVPAVPVGTYKFFCLPHRAYDEHAEMKVE